MSANSINQVFKGQFLSTTTYRSEIVSCPFEVDGSTLVLTGMVINVSAAATVTFELEASWDNTAWTAIGSFNQNSFGHSSVGANNVTQALYRVHVTITGSSVSVYFNASVASSHPQA